MSELNEAAFRKARAAYHGRIASGHHITIGEFRASQDEALREAIAIYQDAAPPLTTQSGEGG